MHFIFPSKFIYWTKVKNHEKIKEKYYGEILKQEKNIEKNNTWLAKVRSSYGNEELNQIFHDNYFAPNVIWPNFDTMLSEMFQSNMITFPQESYLSYCWYNLYDKGDFQESHQHDKNYTLVDGKYHSSVYCGIYLLHLEEKNKTVFYQEPPLASSIVNDGFHLPTEFIEEGNIIFFPSTLTHYVLPAESKRCTVSFNLISVYDSPNLSFPIRTN